MYGVPVSRTCTMYKSSLPILPCTPYSCQVTSSSLPDPAERTRLTRAAVADRALTLADKSGLEALTIRKLATELGVTPMALYWHFRGKDELLDGLAERLWSELDLAVDRAAPWTEQIRGLFESLVKMLRAHPAAPQLLLHSEKTTDASLKATELTLDILRTAGFSPEDASFAARSALWTGITLVMSEPGIKSLDDAERAEIQRQKQVALATQSPVKFPRLVECALPMTSCDNPEEHYRFGTDLFIGGLAAIAAARGPQGQQSK
jgi:TetR/AcrR family transcriptional regulator, tetracycline repressor protein